MGDADDEDGGLLFAALSPALVPSPGVRGVEVSPCWCCCCCRVPAFPPLPPPAVAVAVAAAVGVAIPTPPAPAPETPLTSLLNRLSAFGVPSRLKCIIDPNSAPWPLCPRFRDPVKGIQLVLLLPPPPPLPPSAGFEVGAALLLLLPLLLPIGTTPRRLPLPPPPPRSEWSPESVIRLNNPLFFCVVCGAGGGCVFSEISTSSNPPAAAEAPAVVVAVEGCPTPATAAPSTAPGSSSRVSAGNGLGRWKELELRLVGGAKERESRLARGGRVEW